MSEPKMIANYHTHTWRCHHATGTEEEYIQCALDRGMQILGFSDHSPYLFSGDYYSGYRMRPEELIPYCETVLSLRKAYAGKLEIPLGVELEYYPACFSETLAMLRDSPVEYALLGQHFVGNEVGAAYSGTPTADADILKQYCTQTAQAMQTGLFTYFAHPDLIHFKGEEKVYAQQMRFLCAEARNCGMPLELNLLGIREGRQYPNPKFWQIAAEEGCQVILGCDAHSTNGLKNRECEEKVRQLACSLGLTLVETVPLRQL